MNISASALSSPRTLSLSRAPRSTTPRPCSNVFIDMGFFNLLMFDHHIPWNPHHKVYKNIGDVDGLNMAMRGELVLFVATSLGVSHIRPPQLLFKGFLPLYSTSSYSRVINLEILYSRSPRLIRLLAKLIICVVLFGVKWIWSGDLRSEVSYLNLILP